MIFADNACVRTTDGYVLFGTDRGILRYDPSKDKRNEIEPILNFNQVFINDSLWENLEEISLPYGNYQLEIFFTGISLRNPEKVSYQYFLEGNDLDWSPISNLNFARYQRLSAGDYVFKVRAFNSDAFGGTIIKTIHIHIDQPFWMKLWFWVLCALFLFVVIRFIVRRRERLLREQQEFLQHELDARTREVVEQKELLEVKNKDITDSIVYAKNSQKAMLPPHNVLSEYFADSFVFYKPRDIVSGDFYWAARFESKVLIACADCTGHGVPGAFMSLIGTTVLKEVARMKNVTSPQALLNTMDVEIFNLLNNKAQDFQIDDGMDMSVIEFDLETKKIRLSSANRPILIYTNNAFIEIKGDRRPIGGSMRREEQSFEMQELQLEAGDIIYMFSDGITDQFGGPLGKKWKKSGLKSLLEKCANMGMDRQSEELKTQFNAWKGALPQTDDVIVLGMRV
jgi:serine phosphatase RsbU (regulator of sigma subunit)